MLPYWLLFTVFAAGALQNRRRAMTGRRAGPLLVLGGLFLAAMVGLRFQVGADWFAYGEMFQTAGYVGFWDAIRLGDPGYSFINWLAHSIGADIWFVNLVCALIFSWGLIRFARQQTNPWLTVVVAIPYLVVVVAMGYTRQAVAIGLIMAGMASMAERHSFFRLCLFIVAAAAFHRTAIIILPLIAFSIERNRTINLAVLASVGYLLYDLYLAASVDQLVAGYIDAQYESEGAGIRVAMNLVPAAIFLLAQDRFGFTPEQKKLWRNFSFTAIGLLVLLFVLPSSTAVDRLALYIIPLQLVILSRVPDAFHLEGRRNAQLLLLVIGYSALVQFVWLTYATHADAWLPYQLYPLTTQPGL